MLSFNHKGKNIWDPVNFPNEMLSFKKQLSPIYANNTIISNNSNGDLLGFDLKGNVKWSISLSDDNKYNFDLDSSDILAQIVFDQHNLYVSGGINHFSAINIESGKILWDRKLYDLKKMT